MEHHHSFTPISDSRLQLWTADLYPVTLSRATEEVYTTFFYSTTAHTLHQQSDKILFGHFMITLNAAFNWQLSLADEGYESSSDTIDLPTLLRKTPRIHHVSSIEHASFNPEPVTPQNTPQTSPRPVHRQLSFSSTDDNNTPATTPPTPGPTPTNTLEYLEDEEEEDFQTVPLDDDYWTTKEIPDRTLCIHEHALLHGLCPYPCTYGNYQVSSYVDSLDLSDISDFEGIMITSSNEDIPALEDTPY